MAKKVPAKKLDNKNIVVCVVIVVVVAILVALLVSSVFKKEKPSKTDKIEDKTQSDEKTMERDYGFTKEDAIKVVKQAYRSDNYKFEAEANIDNTYIVTVTNIENNVVRKYIVDPSDGSFTMLEDE